MLQWNVYRAPLGKEALYGSLDPTTLEWTDGIFTKVLREVGVFLALFTSARFFMTLDSFLIKQSITPLVMIGWSTTI